MAFSIQAIRFNNTGLSMPFSNVLLLTL